MAPAHRGSHEPARTNTHRAFAGNAHAWRVPSIVEGGAQRPSCGRSNPSRAKPPTTRFVDTQQLPGLDGLRCLAILPVHLAPRDAAPPAGRARQGRGGRRSVLRAQRLFDHDACCYASDEPTARSSSAPSTRGVRCASFRSTTWCLGFYALRALQTQASSEVARHFLHSLPFHATYTANWFVDYAVPHPVMFAFSWSLCVEEQFYWIWPAWWRCCRTARFWRP